MNIDGLCKWLKETKGITKINLEELVTYVPEYEKYLVELDRCPSWYNEDETTERMNIIGQNGNDGEHYQNK
jgi:hypothetical protein